jgi:hypothetical protein
MAYSVGKTCREMSIVKRRFEHLPTHLDALVHETAGANNRPTDGRHVFDILCTPFWSPVDDAKPCRSRRLIAV